MGAPKRIGYIAAERIWGNLWLGPGAHIAAPGGIIGGFNTPGNVFFVDFSNGNNAWDGTLPERDGVTTHGPFQTIAYALTQCVDDHDDYIIVVDDWNEPTPIAVNVTRVHIIGLSVNPMSPLVALTATGDTAVFTLHSSGNGAEIAGFLFGGGATHGGIENVASTPMAVYIHDCVFGHAFAANTPAHGINIALNATAMCIERCIFLGNLASALGTITANGIRWNTAASNYNALIRKNLFLGCLIGINISARGDALIIKDNEFTCPNAANGEAITLGLTSLGCLVDGNSAMSGSGPAMGFRPFRDLGANHWGLNRENGVGIQPILV